MIKHFAVFLIFLILLGHTQIINAAQNLHNDFIDYYIVKTTNNNIKEPQKTFYRNELTFKRISLWETQEKKKGETLFMWLTKEVITTNSWNYYKKIFISEDGRVIDHQRGSVTTSEGQAYAMRRALIMKDKITFDKTYNWAKYNLQRKNDHLFAWLWGQKSQGLPGKIEYGIIDNNGASDAGTEIAICLILAHKLWHQENYLEDALKILDDIWDKETIEIKGERILTAGINQTKKYNIEINPSYFLIYGFKIFALVDKKHDWLKLVNSSYRLTNWCIDNLKSGLPPDIFYINRRTGAITFDENKSCFSYDAIRIFYRFYIDYKLTGDVRAKKLLSKSKFFIAEWKQSHRFYTNYKPSGKLKNYDEPIGSIALMLPVIKMYDRKTAQQIYKERINSQYHKEGYWYDPMDYYAQNLIWFGNFLYQNDENVKIFKY